MDYKRKYEVQLKINNKLEKEIGSLRLYEKKVISERDALLLEVQRYQTQRDILNEYERKLKEEIGKAREIQQQYTIAINDAKTVSSQYEKKMKRFFKVIKNVSEKFR